MRIHHPDFGELLRIAFADLYIVLLQCGRRRSTSAKIWIGSIAGTFFASAHYPT
jgi:hypothetical protein